MIKIVTNVRGQIRLTIFSANFFPWVNLERAKWADYDAFQWENKDARVLFSTELSQ